MTDPLILVAIAAGLALFVGVAIRRRRRDLRQYLGPALRRNGVEFLSAKSAPMFHTGPFPMIEGEAGRPITRGAGISGEYMEYKIVKVRDSSGSIHEIWACVEFEVFKFRRTRWRAANKQGLPPELLAMLEN